MFCPNPLPEEPVPLELLGEVLVVLPEGLDDELDELPVDPPAELLPLEPLPLRLDPEVLPVEPLLLEGLLLELL